MMGKEWKVWESGKCWLSRSEPKTSKNTCKNIQKPYCSHVLTILNLQQHPTSQGWAFLELRGRFIVFMTNWASPRKRSIVLVQSRPWRKRKGNFFFSFFLVFLSWRRDSLAFLTSLLCLSCGEHAVFFQGSTFLFFAGHHPRNCTLGLGFRGFGCEGSSGFGEGCGGGCEELLAIFAWRSAWFTAALSVSISWWFWAVSSWFTLFKCSMGRRWPSAGLCQICITRSRKTGWEANRLDEFKYRCWVVFCSFSRISICNSAVIMLFWWISICNSAIIMLFWWRQYPHQAEQPQDPTAGWRRSTAVAAEPWSTGLSFSKELGCVHNGGN